MAERHIEDGTGGSDLDIRGDHGLAAADRGPHWLTQHRVNARPAMFHLAVDADECALTVGYGWSIEQLDEIRHEPFAKHCPCLKERPQILDKASGEGVGDHRHPDRTHDRSWRLNSELREDHLACRDDLADFDHRFLL